MKKIFLFFTFLTILLYSADVYSQTTHAHSTTRQWHGINVLDIWNHRNDKTYLDEHYPNIRQTYTYVGKDANNKDVYSADAGCGYPIYLYNVGTGRFIIEGGDWGMESRLFYEDFGRQMLLILEESSPGNGDWKLRINSHVTEQSNSDKCRLTFNVPTVTKKDGWDSNAISFTTIMDGYKWYGNWNFERVETDPESEIYTFRMSQQYSSPYNGTSSKYQGAFAKDIIFRYGAAYGEWQVPDSEKGNGYYVHIDDDRSCWTSAGNANNSEDSPWGNKTKVLVNGDMVEIDELYQWRIISADEFDRVLNEETVGINPSISSLVPDRDFTRNSNEFVAWNTDRIDVLDEFNATNGGRYGYTWGYVSPGYGQDSLRYNKTQFYDESWNAPIMLKQTWPSEMKSAKYGFMSFEGCGVAYVRFEVPHPGWYEVESVAINFAPSDHPAYIYAYAQGAEPLYGEQSAMTAHTGYQQMPIERLDNFTSLNTLYNDIDFPATDPYKRTKALNLSVGKTLTNHSADFSHKFWIYFTPENYSETCNKLEIGIIKELATKAYKGSRKVVLPGDETETTVKYYYDADWVVLDNIRVSYMGLAPAFLYEDDEDLQYLVYDKEKEKDRPGATPDKKYSGSLSLARSMKKGQWNSFSMPVPLIGEQLRAAFGEDAQLLELHSIGGLSENASIIDFQSVELKPTDPYKEVVTPGKFYLLKPTADPVDGLDPRGLPYQYYELGRNFFTVNPHINDGKQKGDEGYYTHYVMDPSVLSGSAELESWNGENNGAAYVSYVRTPGYNTFAVTSGVYNGVTAPAGTYAPKGSYVMSSGKIYEINKDTRIKGFRGWITLSNSLFATSSSAKISIDGVVDEDGATGIDVTSIVPQRLADDTAVYDLGGRKVGTLGMTLPKGIYIVNGKKFMVN